MACIVCGCPGTNRCKTSPCKRPTRQERGYGAEHDRLRAAWKPLVAAGGVDCYRCEEPIEPGTRWDLGHDDVDRSKYSGPEHADECNRSAGGRAAHGLPPRPRRSTEDDDL